MSASQRAPAGRARVWQLYNGGCCDEDKTQYGNNVAPMAARHACPEASLGSRNQHEDLWNATHSTQQQASQAFCVTQAVARVVRGQQPLLTTAAAKSTHAMATGADRVVSQNPGCVTSATTSSGTAMPTQTLPKTLRMACFWRRREGTQRRVSVGE